MNKLNTEIFWTITNHCKSECSYCPSRFRNGDEPKHISEYIKIAQLLIDNFKKQNRIINWIFNGGELLDMFDFPELLKFCKTSLGNIDLTTNGGKLWLDWWAIEPYIDTLIKFIIQTFQKNNKNVNITVPIRPSNYFDSDMNRALEITNEFNINVNKTLLFKDGASELGYLDYTEEQFEIVLGKEWVENNLRNPPKTYKEIQEIKVATNPSFTGILCNVGVEKLLIDPSGWVQGSSCNTLHLGNIWHDGFRLPDRPSACKMLACIDQQDQKITKFI